MDIVLRFGRMDEEAIKRDRLSPDLDEPLRGLYLVRQSSNSNFDHCYTPTFDTHPDQMRFLELSGWPCG